MWHMIHDIWYVTCDTWREVNLLSKCQVSSSYGLGVKVLWRYLNKRNTYIMNEWMTMVFEEQPHTLPQENADPFVILHLNCYLILSFVTKLRVFHVLLKFLRAVKYESWVISCIIIRSGGSLYLGFVILPSPLNNCNETWNHLILVKDERIKWKVRCRMTKESTFSWGNVPG